MKTALFAFTRQGVRLSLIIKKLLEQQQHSVTCYTTSKFCAKNAALQPITPSLTVLTGQVFKECLLLIFIGASGIAVRAIAPFIADKHHDPAVICIDEKGQYVIPLLSGHIGGANRFAHLLAGLLQAQPVITTASDINGLIAVDEWAVRNQVVAADANIAKKIAAALLDGVPIGVSSDFEIDGEIPDYFRPGANDPTMGLCISLDETKKPYGTTLNLIPKIVYLGIGCRKGITCAQLETGVAGTLKRHNISIQALAGIVSIDLKKEEQGLLDFAAKYSLPITFYSAHRLQEVQGNFTPSDFVQQVAGTDNVCERAAVLASGGQLISAKTANNGVTTALALKPWRVNFGN